GGPFPLTPPLSLGERQTPSRRGAQSKSLGFPLRDARSSLSLGERVRVRGNDANDSSPASDHFSELLNWTSPPAGTCLALACDCSGSHLGCRRGRHLAARNGASERGIDGEARRSIRRAGCPALRQA